MLLITVDNREKDNSGENKTIKKVDTILKTNGNTTKTINVATALCQNVVYEICIVNTHMQIKYFGYNMLTLVLVMSISCSYYLGELKSYCSILNLVDSFDTIVRLI